MTDVSGQNDAARAAAERPARRRAAMWDSIERIRQLLSDGRSYGQIVRMLHLSISPSRLGKWCRAAGLVQPRLQNLSPRAAGAEKKVAATAANPLSPSCPAPSPSPSLSEAGNAKSISELLREDEAAQRAELARFFKPKSEA